jgi:hypothetical protein
MRVWALTRRLFRRTLASRPSMGARRISIDPELLEWLYVEETLSIVAIAARLGCADNTVLRLYVSLVSASRRFLDWIKASIGPWSELRERSIVAAPPTDRYGFFAMPRPNPFGSSPGCTMRRTFPASPASAPRP